MPIPEPEANENKNEYISRCIKFLVGEGKPQDQASAICYQKWEGRKMKENKDGKNDKFKTYTIDNVPILKEGKFTDANGKEVNLTDEKLTEIVENTNALIKAHQHEPPLKLGHNENQKLIDGLPAIGWVAKLKKIGNQVFADFVNVPKKIYDLILSRAYAKVSSELYEELNIENKNVGMALRAVALLGADVPAIKGLGDIENLYASERPYNILIFAENELQEVNSMSVEKNLWTLERVEKMLPCCVEAVKKFMEEKKLEAIDIEDLVKIITNIKITELKKLQEEQQKNKQKEVDEKLKAFANSKQLFAIKEDLQEFLKILVEEFKKLTPENLSEIQKLVNDKRPPKGWWDDCVKSVANVTDTPETLCGWIYHHWMSPERKAEIEGTRASENPNNSGNSNDSGNSNNSNNSNNEDEEKRKKEEEEKQKLLNEKKEAEAKLKEMELKQRQEKIKEIIEKNRGVFLPKFDTYINTLSEALLTNDTVIKFGEKDEKPSDLFIQFLDEIAKSKVVIFEELMKSENKEKYDEIRKQKVEKVLSKLKDKYSGITDKGYQFAEEELELVALATVISEDENIGFADAYSKAKKTLNK